LGKEEFNERDERMNHRAREDLRRENHTAKPAKRTAKGMAKRFHAVMRAFAAEATFLHAAEGGDFRRDEAGVDAHHA
jgi:hypothetical protein